MKSAATDDTRPSSTKRRERAASCARSTASSSSANHATWRLKSRCPLTWKIQASKGSTAKPSAASKPAASVPPIRRPMQCTTTVVASDTARATAKAKRIDSAVKQPQRAKAAA